MDVDTNNLVVRYASAGHPPGILINSNREILYLSKTGPLIGAKPNCKYAQVEYPFLEKERIYIFTDGILKNL